MFGWPPNETAASETILVPTGSAECASAPLARWTLARCLPSFTGENT